MDLLVSRPSDFSSIWFPVTHAGCQDWVPCFQLPISLVLAMAAFGEWTRRRETCFSFLSLYLYASLLLSLFLSLTPSSPSLLLFFSNEYTFWKILVLTSILSHNMDPNLSLKFSFREILHRLWDLLLLLLYMQSCVKRCREWSRVKE